MYIVCLINLNGYKLDKYLNPERFACVSDLRSITTYYVSARTVFSLNFIGRVYYM